MTILLAPALLLALLVAFGAGVVFWAGLSQIRFFCFFRRQTRQPPSLGAIGWWRFYRDTLFGAYRLLWWFFRAAFRAGLRSPAAVTGRPVLCVHGLFMNSSSMWGLRRRLEALGRPTRGVFMGVPFPTPLRYAEPLTKVMQDMAERFPDQGFDIVAHSIGGVMTREVLRRHPELANAIGCIVTLGSPHRGTAALRWMRFGAIYRILNRQSTWLATLPDLRAVAPGVPTVTIASWHDLVVYPVEVALLDGSHHSILTAVSHLGLLTDERAWVQIEAALGRVEP